MPKLGSTVALQAEGQLHEAARDIVNYVQGGFSALQHGAIDINYLPCYAAAGLVVKLGMFNSLGKVGTLCDALVIHNL